MQKVIKYLIAGVVGVAVIASAFFFCCADKIVHVSSLKITNAAADDCCKGNHFNHSKENKFCPCFFNAFTVAQAQLSTRSFVLSNTLNSPEVISSFVQTAYAVSLRTDHPDVCPDQHCSVPLYIRYRSIRI